MEPTDLTDPPPPAPPRQARTSRSTKETSISVDVKLDGGEVAIETPSGFFTHMLTALASYAGWGLKLHAEGDAHVDLHHTVEDAGLVLGDALAAALGDFSGHRRFASALVPMDDALAEAALDAGRRPFLHFEAAFPQPVAGNFDFCLAEEFFRALVTRAGWTLHLTGRRGRNSHHLAEALFKATGLAAATALAPRAGLGPFSTKGVL
ncbi:MAG: imidazoleglycerol-phosphate dehydratase HisB [Deltaproteobacteria bacterium]|jgi:imidazoleglycerol-phosphate dehydratase|nr:imidazoleglycerol-phosphate dehydratase HisB [Deltaproteobacteria bacterium]